LREDFRVFRNEVGEESPVQLTGVEMTTLAGLVATGFVVTNTDNLVILVVLLGANPKGRYAVLLGFFAATIAVICVSAIGIALGSLLGGKLIGYLGLAPLLIGCHMLYSNDRGRVHEIPKIEANIGGPEPRVWLSTFLLLLGNSGDSVAVFLPLLADSGRQAPLIFIVCYLSMSLLCAGLSCLIAGRRSLAQHIEQRAEVVLPWFMIAMGIYILSNSATDSLA
jgi:cadmium resistance protein CadD (predicted permease)